MPVSKQSVENTLTLISSVEGNWTRRFYVEDTLVLNQETIVDEIIKQVYSTLDLTHELSQNQLVESLSNTISFSQNAVGITNILLDVSNTLNLQQSFITNFHYRAVENVLDLQQEIVFKVPSDYSLASNLSDCWWTDEEINTLTAEELEALCDDRGLRQSVEVRRSITNIAVTSYLQLQQNAVKSLALQVGNHIHLLGVANTVAAYEQVLSELSLSQSLSYDKTTLVVSTLELVQTVDPDATFNRSLSSTLNLSQYTVHIDEDLYAPSPEFSLPNLVSTGSVILTYPFFSPIRTVTLRSPEFDNIEQLEFQRINRRTRGGDLTIHRQDYWPIAERLSMNFTNLTHSVGDSLLEFLAVSIGQEIGLLDNENRQWRGLILTPSARLSADTGRECQYSVSIEFEGITISDTQLEVGYLSTGLLTGALT
jgi:hypothetical protein